MYFHQFRFLVLLCFFYISLAFGLEPQLFLQKLNEPTPKWMVDQIEHDLKPFQKELSKKYLDELFASQKEPLYLMRVRIANNVMTIEASETSKDYGLAKLVISGLHKLQQIVPLPDIDFIFTGHDVWGLHISAIKRNEAVPSFPIFAIAKHKEDPGIILMPDWYALREFQPDIHEILRGNRKYRHWQRKIPRLFFRGSDSGVFDRANWRNCGRPKLVALSLQRPDLINARFTCFLDYPTEPHIREIMIQEGMQGQHLPLSEFSRFRYLMDVDGHTANTPRVALWLHSNSVMFKQNSPDILWFFSAMQPFVHYIPVEQDLSDTFSMVEWAKDHDHECRQIVKNANYLASQILSPEGIYLYLYRLLEAYSHKQKQWND